MAARTIAEFAVLAVEHGLDPATPAIAVARATRPDERVIASTISDLPKQLVAQSVPGPLLVLIGRALAQYDAAAVAEAVDQARKQVNGD
jgi:uroporphyrin-III C-methyltransferase/precorrin-2 dehydrogenase/sirohydrochlorin ferrochelatase